jgi:hypothetical protein
MKQPLTSILSVGRDKKGNPVPAMAPGVHSPEQSFIGLGQGMTLKTERGGEVKPSPDIPATSKTLSLN